MPTDNDTIISTLFPSATDNTNIPCKVFIDDLIVKYKDDRVAVKTLTRVFFNQCVETFGIPPSVLRLTPKGASESISLSKAIDKMNKGLLCSLILQASNHLAKSDPTQALQQVILELQDNIDDCGSNEEDEKGKKLFAYGVPFNTKPLDVRNNTHDTSQLGIGSKSFPAVALAKKLEVFFNEYASTSKTTTTTKKEKTMTFDVNKANDKVVAMAMAMAKHDIEDGLDTIENCVSKRLDKALQEYGNKHTLTSEERVSLKASVDLTMPTYTEEDIDRIFAENKDDAREYLPSDVEPNDEHPLGINDKEKVVPIKPVKIDKPELKPAVESMLSQMTSGVVTDIEELLQTKSQLAELQSSSENLKKELSTLRSRSFAAQAASTGEAKVDGKKLKYEVVMRKASDIFRNPRSGRKITQLDFEIPTLIWKDDEGKVVRHPMCPDTNVNYQFRASHLIKFLTAYLLGKNVWLHGHTGTGKTTLPEQVASLIGLPLFPLNLDSQLERADLTGQTNLIEQNGTTITKFEEGILPRAMVLPCFLVLDEIDAGKPDILFAIQRATEGKGLLLTEDGGRLVKPHPLFRFVATANSRGQGDEHGVYAGVRPMNGALLNRFGTFIEIDYMTPEEESALLEREYKLPKDITKNLVEFAKLCRKAFKSGETSVPVSPRDTTAVAEFYTHYSAVLTTKTQAIEYAIDNAILSRCPIDNRQRVVELASRCFADCKFTN